MVTFSSLISLLISLTFILVQYLTACVSGSDWKIRFDPRDIQWWYLLPPLTVVLIGIGMASMTSLLSVSTVFVLFILGQLFTSLVWDTLIKGGDLSTMRVVGTFLVLVGSIMVSKA